MLITQIVPSTWIDYVIIILTAVIVCRLFTLAFIFFPSRTNDFELLVALDKDGYATGFLYWDDGDSLSKYSMVSFVILMFWKVS